MLIYINFSFDFPAVTAARGGGGGGLNTKTHSGEFKTRLMMNRYSLQSYNRKLKADFQLRVFLRTSAHVKL